MSAESWGIVTTSLPCCPLQVGGSGNKDIRAHGEHTASTETWVCRVSVIKGAHLPYLVQGLWEELVHSECFWPTTFACVKGWVAKVQRKKPFEGHTKRTFALPCYRRANMCFSLYIIWEHSASVTLNWEHSITFVFCPLDFIFFISHFLLYFCPWHFLFRWNYLFLIHSYPLIIRERHIGRIIF